MTIEFECTTCDKPLRAADETAGQKIKCERCGTLLTVPAPAQFLWPPGAGPDPRARSGGQADTAKPEPPRPSAPLHAPAPRAAPASNPGIAPSAAAAPLAVPIESTAPAASRPLATPPPQPIGLAPRAAATSAPLVEDFDSLFDPDELDGQTRSSGTARVLGNSAGISIGDVIASTWRIYLANIWLCLAAFIVLSLAMAVAATVASLAAVALHALTADDKSSALVMAGAVYFIWFAIAVWLQVGYLKFTLNLARGEGAAVADLFGAGFVWLEALVISLLQAALAAAGVFAAAATGSPLLALPGVMLALLIEPSKLVLVDARRGVIDAVQQAVWLTVQNILPLAAIFPIAVVVLVAGCIVTLGLGAVFIVPLVVLAYAVTYLRMTGQRTADRGA